MNRKPIIWVLLLTFLFSGALPCQNIIASAAVEQIQELVLVPEENGDTYLDVNSPSLGASFGTRIYLYDRRSEDECVVEVLENGRFERTIADAPSDAIKMQAGDAGLFVLTESNQVYLCDGESWQPLDLGEKLSESAQSRLSLNDIVYRNNELYVLYSYLNANLMTECIKHFSFANGEPQLVDQFDFSMTTRNISTPKCTAFVLLTSDLVSDKIYVLSNTDLCLYNQDNDKVTALPKTYTHFSTDNEYLYLSSTVGLDAYRLSDIAPQAEAQASMLPADDASHIYTKGDVKEFTASFVKDNQICVIDRVSHAVTSFRVSGSSFLLGDLSTYSASTGGYSAPQSVYATEEAVYIADSGNSRIKRIRRDENGTVADLLSTAQIPESVCADGLGNLWYLSRSMLYWVENFEEGRVSARTLEGISSMAADDKGGVYVLNPEGVYHYADSQDNTPELLFSESGQKAIAYLDKAETLYLLTDSGILLYDTRNSAKLATVRLDGAAQAEQIIVDYYGNLYLSDGETLRCYVGEEIAAAAENSSDTSLPAEQTYALNLTRNGRKGTVSDFAINRADGTLLFVSPDMHCLAQAPAETLRAKVRTDAPELTADVDIYSGKAQTVLEYRTVSSYSSVFYPDGEPAVTLEDGTRVMVLEEQGEYAYVFCGDRGGWIYSRYTAGTQLSEPEVKGKDMRVLRGNTAYLTLPSLRENEDDAPLFSAGVLKKGDPVVVTADLGLLDGIRWYAIEMDGATYYLPSTAIGEYRDESVHLYEHLTLSSAQDVALYSAPSEDSEILLTLPSGSKVVKLEELDGWYLVQAEDENGNLVKCYVSAKYVVPDGLTTAQKTGLILFGVIIVVGIVLLVLRKKFKKI